MDGIESVPRNRQWLFGQFERRITENTKAIKLWILEVERAQEARKQEMKELLSNQPKITFHFPIKHSDVTRTRDDGSDAFLQNTSNRDTWAQQDLRQLLLQTKPNVRFRNS